MIECCGVAAAAAAEHGELGAVVGAFSAGGIVDGDGDSHFGTHLGHSPHVAYPSHAALMITIIISSTLILLSSLKS